MEKATVVWETKGTDNKRKCRLVKALSIGVGSSREGRQITSEGKNRDQIFNVFLLSLILSY